MAVLLHCHRSAFRFVDKLWSRALDAWYLFGRWNAYDLTQVLIKEKFIISISTSYLGCNIIAVMVTFIMHAIVQQHQSKWLQWRSDRLPAVFIDMGVLVWSFCSHLCRSLAISIDKNVAAFHRANIAKDKERKRKNAKKRRCSIGLKWVFEVNFIEMENETRAQTMRVASTL